MSNKRRSLSDALNPAEIDPAEADFVEAGGFSPAATAMPAEKNASANPPAAPVILPPLQSTATAHLSVRLDVNLMEALTRAGMTRKIHRQEPFTHKDMVSEALRTYLKKLGFLQ